MTQGEVPLRFSMMFPATERPDPLDHGEQKGRGQTEEQHPV